MADLFAADLEDLRTSGVLVGKVLKPVHLILMGDYAFVTTHCGNKRASSLIPLLWCAAWARPTKLNSSLLRTNGNIKDGSRACGMPRTRCHAEKMAFAYEDGALNEMEVPLSLKEHLSIERCPLFLWAPADNVPSPLLKSLGGTTYLLSVVRLVQA